MASLTTADDEAALAEAAAERLTALLESALAARDAAAVCLTGGKTPERLYRLLADPSRPWRGRIEWPRVQVYWGDERHVPPDHPESNYGLAARALVEHVPIPAHHVHRILAELPHAEEAARQYASVLPPAFDVMLLGLGEDAHIASIFPGSPLIAAFEANPQSLPPVAAVWAPHLNAWRITLTPAAILAAPKIVMLVAGQSKAPAVHAALELPDDPSRYPAHLLRRSGDRAEWFLDRAAAARLTA